MHGGENERVSWEDSGGSHQNGCERERECLLESRCARVEGQGVEARDRQHKKHSFCSLCSAGDVRCSSTMVCVWKDRTIPVPPSMITDLVPDLVSDLVHTLAVNSLLSGAERSFSCKRPTHTTC